MKNSRNRFELVWVPFTGPKLVCVHWKASDDGQADICTWTSKDTSTSLNELMEWSEIHTKEAHS